MPSTQSTVNFHVSSNNLVLFARYCTANKQPASNDSLKIFDTLSITISFTNQTPFILASRNAKLHFAHNKEEKVLLYSLRSWIYSKSLLRHPFHPQESSICNPCHNRAKRQLGSTLEEARSLKKVRSLPFAPTIASTSQKDQNQEEAHIPTPVTPPVSTVADNSSAILEFLKSMDKKIDQICHDKTTPTSAPAQPSSADSNYRAVLKKSSGD